MFKDSIAARLALGLIALGALTMSLDACALGAAAARSGRMADKAKERFNEADADHDGFISREEADKGMPRLAPHFDEIDANHDGKLTTDEIATFLRNNRSH